MKLFREKKKKLAQGRVVVYVNAVPRMGVTAEQESEKSLNRAAVALYGNSVAKTTRFLPR